VCQVTSNWSDKRLVKSSNRCTLTDIQHVGAVFINLFFFGLLTGAKHWLAFFITLNGGINFLIMANRLREILLSRAFTSAQVNKILPTLGRGYAGQPDLLAETIDCWNTLMASGHSPRQHNLYVTSSVPKVASPPSDSLLKKLYNADMNSILADVEPQLLQFEPKKLLQRHQQIAGLGLVKNMNEHWLLLFNSPRGFYLQDWEDLSKKVMYITNEILDLLYEKKEMKEMQVHPLVKSAACVELEYDHIRTRYLFAERVGFKDLAQLYDVTDSKSRLDLSSLLLSDDVTFMKKFAPYCKMEEYICFKKLVKQVGVRDDDSDLYEEMAELQSIKYNAWPKRLSNKMVREALEEKRRSREENM